MSWLQEPAAKVVGDALRGRPFVPVGRIAIGAAAFENLV